MKTKVCIVCGTKFKVPQTSKVRICSDTCRNQRIRNWQDKRKAEGMCITCGKPREQFATYCNDCHEKHLDYDRKRRRRDSPVAQEDYKAWRSAVARKNIAVRFAKKEPSTGAE